MFSSLSKISIVWYNIFAFVLGAIAGVAINTFFGSDKDTFDAIIATISPFGTILVSILKAVVIPIIFFSLIGGASNLPLKKFGNLGTKVVIFYLCTSIFATIFGIIVACLMSPSIANAGDVSSHLLAHVEEIKSSTSTDGNVIVNMLISAFSNPFKALAEAQFLSIIVFAILFGLAARAVIESSSIQEHTSVIKMLEVFDGINKAIFKMISWLLCYFPVGIFALTAVNFAAYGSALFDSYADIATCVIVGIVLMVFFVYPAIVFFFCRENPYKILSKIKEPIITAFATRSSAATLPISLQTANDKLGIKPELSSFSLSLGATINMDGVCIHLPVFVILATSMFGIDMTIWDMTLVLFSVVIASIGVGGVPGGSIFLLFMVLDVLNLTPQQTSTIVALALGINPLLDMFETACNVAGDNIGNYVIAKKSNMLKEISETNN